MVSSKLDNHTSAILVIAMFRFTNRKIVDRDVSRTPLQIDENAGFHAVKGFLTVLPFFKVF